MKGLTHKMHVRIIMQGALLVNDSPVPKNNIDITITQFILCNLPRADYSEQS